MWSCSFPIYICGIKFVGWDIFLVLAIATKAAMASPKSFTIFLNKPITPSCFQTNVLFMFSFTNCYGHGFMLIFVLNLGFYYNDVEHIRHKYHNRQYISIRKSLSYSIYDGVVHRARIINVGIENFGSAGQFGFTYRALVGRVTKYLCVFCI